MYFTLAFVPFGIDYLSSFLQNYHQIPPIFIKTWRNNFHTHTNHHFHFDTSHSQRSYQGKMQHNLQNYHQIHPIFFKMWSFFFFLNHHFHFDTSQRNCPVKKQQKYRSKYELKGQSFFMNSSIETLTSPSKSSLLVKISNQESRLNLFDKKLQLTQY